MAITQAVITSLNVYTLLSSDTLPTLAVTDVIAIAYETDTGVVYEWSGGIWNIIKANGGLSTSAAAFSKMSYSDLNFEYIGESAPGTALTAASWRVKRIDNTTFREQWADGDDRFNNVMTDLATVAGLTYV